MSKYKGSNSIWIFVIILLFVASFIVLGRLGLFNFQGSDPSAKIVVGALALVGSLIASLVTIIGIVIKQSLDQRNLELKEQAERRLELEAAIQAINLLSTSSGLEAPDTQRAGALFTLVHLGQPALSLTMLRQMLLTDRIDSETAATVINIVLKSGNEELIGEVSGLMHAYPEKFLSDKGRVALPEYFWCTWSTKLPEISREDFSTAICKMILARPYKEWKPGQLNMLVVTLSEAWKTETAERIRDGVASCLEEVISTYKTAQWLYTPSGKLILDQFRKELSQYLQSHDLETTFEFKELSQRLKEWAKQGVETYSN